jgi:hypothetical protein
MACGRQITVAIEAAPLADCLFDVFRSNKFLVFDHPNLEAKNCWSRGLQRQDGVLKA